MNKDLITLVGFSLAVSCVFLLGCQGGKKEEAQEKAPTSRAAAEVPVATAAPTPQAGTQGSGEELFKEHCAVCHPDGGNVINPEKTLQRSDLEANGIGTVQGIVSQMRKPGPGMTPFDEARISDEEARKVAEYILEEFD